MEAIIWGSILLSGIICILFSKFNDNDRVHQSFIVDLFGSVLIVTSGIIATIDISVGVGIVISIIGLVNSIISTIQFLKDIWRI